MNALDVFLGIWVVILILSAGDIVLRQLVGPETIERWADRIFGL